MVATADRQGVSAGVYNLRGKAQPIRYRPRCTGSSCPTRYRTERTSPGVRGNLRLISSCLLELFLQDVPYRHLYVQNHGRGRRHQVHVGMEHRRQLRDRYSLGIAHLPMSQGR